MDGFFWGGGFLWPFYFMIFFFFAFVVALAFWVWMVIDCATRTFKGEVDKIVWILILIFLNLLGAFIYFLTVYIRKEGDEREIVKKRKRRRFKKVIPLL